VTAELAVRPDPQGTVMTLTKTMASLADWAAELTAASTLAEALCRTSFVPEHFRGKPMEAAAAILTGFEVGLSPLAALRSIFVIKGTPGMYAKTMVAIVTAAGHEVWVEEQSDDRVVVKGRRKGSDRVVETMWDRARVEKAKLTSNAKYQETPQQMMVARGQAEVCRLVAPDALLGIPYSGEELEDLPPIQAGPATVGQRVTAAEVLGTVAPAPTQPDDQPEQAQPAEGGMTVPQQRKLYALLKEKGMTNRVAALEWMAGMLERPADQPVESTKTLTSREAGIIIDELERLPDAAASAASLPAGGAE
jgi:hypothetical protein